MRTVAPSANEKELRVVAPLNALIKLEFADKFLTRLGQIDI